ncbi:hypothetical protein D3C84_831700 [compost metagenome]
MQQVGPALGATQRVVGAAGVEQQAVGQGVGQLQHLLGRGVDHEQAQALVVQRPSLGQQRLRGAGAHSAQCVALLEEAASAVAVGDGEFCAAQAGVDRFGNHVGQQWAACGLPGEVADAHLQAVVFSVDLCRDQGGAGQRQQVG